MGKASRKKQKKRVREASSDLSATVTSGHDSRTLGEEALGRLMRSNTPGKLSLAGAYAWGYAALGHAQQEGTDPLWHQETDPLDVLFLGTVWPKNFRDEFEFANARDAWLRLLRDTVHGKGIQRFVREAVSASEDLGLPVDDARLMLALAGRLEAAGLDQRRLPRRCCPSRLSRTAARSTGRLSICDSPTRRRTRRSGSSGSGRLGRRVVVRRNTSNRASRRTAPARGSELPVKEESGMLLPALYTALMTKPGELLEDMGRHAWEWAVSLDESSPLVPVLDILLVAPELEMSVTETLGRLFAVPAFTEPFPPDALLWTSSPGLALPRLAFELDIPEVTTQDRTLTPDLLDWVGMHTRMSLSAAARDSSADLDLEDTDSTQQDSDGQWAERREAVREAAQQRMRKKSGGAAVTRHRPSRPVERIWNADGSSVIHISTGTSRGQQLMEGLENQLEAFREKFGREPGPGDPLFFDPDATNPPP